MGVMAPEVSVTVGGTDLVKNLSCIMGDVEVSLSMDGESSAVVEIVETYDHKNHQITAAIADILAVGKKMEISMGYAGGKGKVFSGYLDEVELEFRVDTAGVLRLKGYDVVRLLKNSSRYRIYTEQSCSAVFSSIMGEYSWLCSGKVDAGDNLDEVRTWRQEGSDFDFIIDELVKYHQAEREFYVSLGAAHYTKPDASEREVLVWNAGTGCLGFKTEIHYVNHVVQVQGYSAGYERFTGESDACMGGADSGASKGMRVYQTAEADTSAGAKAMAEQFAKRDVAAGKRISVSMTGKKELLTGAYVKVEELDPLWNGTYRIREARHILNKEGYRTKMILEGC